MRALQLNNWTVFDSDDSDGSDACRACLWIDIHSKPLDKVRIIAEKYFCPSSSYDVW